MTKQIYGQHLVGAKQLLAAAKAIQADVVACGLDEPSKPDPERLRLLVEAVAEAMRALLVAGYGYGTAYNPDAYDEQLEGALDTGTTALAALKAYDDQRSASVE